MEKIKITLPDGKTLEFKKGTTGTTIAQKIGPKLAKEALAIKINNTPTDLNQPITKNAKIQILTFNDEEGKKIFWHSTAHITAQAALRLFPTIKITIGPAIEQGYYYDIDHDQPFTPENIQAIEKEMQKITKENHECEKIELTEKQAKHLFRDNQYKQEIINDLIQKKEKLTAYKQGEFTDLCKGPHIPNTGKIKSLKLTKNSAAYWKGNQNNKQLQRIYGISYPEKKQLTNYLTLIEEAEKRDHRKIGPQLELFTFNETSVGYPYFLPKGMIIYNELIKFLREEYKKRNYQEIKTPILQNKKLWEQSGHWNNYKQNMFTLNVYKEQYAIKPMNCPGHIQIYKTKTKSYKELPIRYAEFGTIHRQELKGVITGLTRVTGMTQDDAHIFCTTQQIQTEIEQLLDFMNHVYKETFNLEFEAEISLRPEENYLGDKQTWDKAEKILEQTLTNKKIKYTKNKGEGAFYGPKIDIQVKDTIQRKHQLATIQLDFQLPQRFQAEYEGPDGKKHTTTIIHRAILGTLERFIAILIEHYAGKLPLWLAPTQATIIPISEKYNKYATKIHQELTKNNIRTEINLKNESVSYKIRETKLQKNKYIIIVGEKEQKENKLTLNYNNQEEYTTLEKTKIRLNTEITLKK